MPSDHHTRHPTCPATFIDTLASNGMDAPTLNGIKVPKWKC